jgi:hypothetical protein
VLQQRRDGLRDIGCRGTTLGALLEKRDLAGEIGELALEIGQGLLRRSVWILADGTLAIRGRRRYPSRRRDPTVADQL